MNHKSPHLSLTAIALLLALVLPAGAQTQAPEQPALPDQFLGRDIGAPSVAGSASVDASNVWTIRANGRGIAGTADSFHFASRSVQGNGSFVSRILTMTGGDPNQAKVGPMIRASDAPGAANAMLAMTQGSGVLFQYRPEQDRETVVAGTNLAPFRAQTYLRLQRVGNDFAGFVSDDGRLWRAITPVRTLTMSDTALYGLAATSAQEGQLVTATVDNVGFQPALLSVFGLNACVNESGILLQWRPLSNVAGFNVFRGAVNASFDQFTKLTATPITEASFPVIDSSLVAGQPVTFAVQTLTRDSAGALVDGPIVLLQATPMTVPPGFTACNIGQGLEGGGVTVDSATNEFTIRSAAGNIGDGNDQFFFLFRPVEGNATVTVTAPARPTLSIEQARAGLMLRESLDEGARFVSLVLTPSNGLLLEARMNAGDANLVSTQVIDNATLQTPVQLRLVRNENTITAQVSRDNGQTFQPVGNPVGFTQALPQTMYAGLAVTGRDDTRAAEARFSNFVVTNP